MKPIVVFFAMVAMACGSLVPLAQPINHPALVLDPRGRPLETEEVINSRTLHLQAKALEGSYGHDYSSAIAPAYSFGSAAPLLGHSALGSAAPLLGVSALGYGGPHHLYKRSLGHYSAHSGAAVSHQSRVDVISSPAVASHAVAAPLVSQAVAAPLVSQAVTSPLAVHAAPLAAPLAVHTAPLAAHGAVLPAASHGNWARINHAAIAPIAQPAAVPVFSGHNSYAAPLINAW